jgi:glycine cleavage system transcriptional repressor
MSKYPPSGVTMQKFVLSVLGKDRPGIVAGIASVLCSLDCNIEDCSQTILQTEFAGIFILSNRENRPLDVIEKKLVDKLGDSGLTFDVKPMAENGEISADKVSTPFVVTTMGPDQIGMIAAITGVLADLAINIINFKAILRKDVEPEQLMTIFEVDVPDSVGQNDLKTRLLKVSDKFNLEFTIQHRAIFEATNKI